MGWCHLAKTLHDPFLRPSLLQTKPCMDEPAVPLGPLLPRPQGLGRMFLLRSACSGRRGGTHGRWLACNYPPKVVQKRACHRAVIGRPCSLVWLVPSLAENRAECFASARLRKVLRRNHCAPLALLKQLVITTRYCRSRIRSGTLLVAHGRPLARRGCRIARLHLCVV